MTTPSKKPIDTIQLSVPCAAEYVGVVRLTVSGVATRMNFSIEEIEDIKIALSEACTNAVQYAFKEGDKNARIDVVFEVYANKLVIMIKDDGIGFDVESASSQKSKIEDLDSLDASAKVPNLGLGMTFINSLMDDAEFISKPGEGTTVMITKYN